ncbi:MAG: hypothetical protein HUJ63_11720, partial [Enterococcus sp.]|nr:hypothetical protein [Enterococcus sp.]
ELLKAFSAKAFIAATKRQQLFFDKEKFEGFTEKQWREHFFEEKRSGRVKGEALDFQIIYPLALTAKKEEYEKSKLTGVIDYIKRQL